jgi:hypothetical protein
MKMLVLPKPIEGVSREEMLRHAPAEIQAVWDLYKQGIVREFYTRANEPNGVVLLLESASVDAAWDALATLHFARFVVAISQNSCQDLAQKGGDVTILCEREVVKRNLINQTEERNRLF